MSTRTTASNPPTSSLQLASEFLDRRTPIDRVRGVMHRYPAVSPAVVLVVAIIVFGILNDRFLAPANLSLITQQVAVVGTLAVAQTLIILTAGIDLSVGAVMVLASMTMAQVATQNGLPPVLALVVGLVVGLAAG
jgi:fructose transport system permease protein